MSKDLYEAGKEVARRMNKKEGHEKGETIAKEKKENMAKMLVMGKGKKKEVLEGLEHMTKHPSVKHYRSGDSHVRQGEGINRRDIYRD